MNRCCPFLLSVLWAAAAFAQDLPKKEAGETGEVDASLFADPPIVLDDRAGRAAEKRPARVPAAKPDVVELQLANVRRLQAQVDGLRKRSATDPVARELLVGAESALRGALSLAAEAGELRRRSEQARVAAQAAHPKAP